MSKNVWCDQPVIHKIDAAAVDVLYLQIKQFV